MNKYELALQEVRSVLSEWDPRPMDDIIATKIVDRLVAKGVIQSTDPEELTDQSMAERYLSGLTNQSGHRTGPLEPGRRTTGGDAP